MATKYVQIDSLENKDVKDIFRVLALETLGSWNAIEETLKVNRHTVIEMNHLRKLIELTNAKVIVKISYEVETKSTAPASAEAQIKQQADEITNPELKEVSEFTPVAVILNQKEEGKTPPLSGDGIPDFTI